MVKIRGTPPTQVMARSRGHVVFHYLSSHRIVVQKWPRKRGKIGHLSPVTQAQVSAWDTVQEWMKSPEPSELEVARQLTANTAFYTRDVMIMAAYGNFISWPGWGWRERLSTNIQVLLDAITNVPGSVIVRDAGGWVGLGPGTAGQVLTAHGTGLDPSWVAPVAGVSGLWGAVVSAPPTQAGSGFASWLHQPASATVADAGAGIVVFQPSAGSAHTFAMLGATPPGGSYAKTALLSGDGPNASFHATVIGFSDGAKSTLLVRQVGTGLFAARYSAMTAAAETVVASIEGGDYFNAQALWVRLRDDGTSIYIDISLSAGAYWRTFYTELRTAWLSSPSHLAFGCENYSQLGAATLLSWA